MDAYESELYRERSEHLAEKRAHRETRAKLDEHVKERAVDAALKQFDAKQADLPLLEEMFRGANLRVCDDVAVIDVDGLTMPVVETPSYMRGLPEKFSNLTDRPKPPAPTKQELRLAEIQKLPMDQYLREHKKPGFFDPRPDQK